MRVKIWQELLSQTLYSKDLSEVPYPIQNCVAIKKEFTVLSLSSLAVGRTQKKFFLNLFGQFAELFKVIRCSP